MLAPTKRKKGRTKAFESQQRAMVTFSNGKDLKDNTD